MNNNNEKDRLRKWAKDLRQSLDLKSKSFLIEQKVLQLDVYRSAKTIMSYHAKDVEVSLNGLFKDDSKSWFLPTICTSDKLNLFVVPYMHGKTKLVKNKFNIFEPDISDGDFFDQVDKKIKLDLIFVPGLCFDKDGNRLGYGAGYYDRFLQLNPKSLKIGICLRECIVDKLPIDAWDTKVDLVITE